MANTGEALLAQVLDAPDDDAPKLVYADWLEEQGSKAAAVIRASLANKKLPKHDFFAGIETWVDDKAPFDRGMVSRIYGSAGKYVAKTTQTALLKTLSVFGARSTMLRGQSAKVPSCAALAYTTSFWWWDCQADDDLVGAFAASPHIARLTSLTLEKLRCGNAGLGKLARSKQLGRLRHLGLRAPVHLGKFDENGVAALLEKLPIESLDMTSGPFAMDFGPVGNAPAASKLVKLAVTAGTDAGGLMKSKALTSLRELRLDLYSTPDAGDFKAFLKNKAFGKLEKLELSHPAHQPLPAAVVKSLRDRFGKNLAYRK
jgi:uncharacterized protein (TIGR02996 family)